MVIKIKLLFLFVFMFFCFCHLSNNIIVYAERYDPLSLIQEVVESQDKLIFEGEMTVIFWSQKGARATVAKIYHNGVQERLEYIASKTQPHKLIISDSTNTYYVQPGRNFLLEKTIEYDELELDRIQLAFKNYDWKLVAEDTHIGHKVVIVEVYPKGHKGAYHRFWIDPDHKLILKKDRFSQDGTLIQTIQFTTIRFVDTLSEKLFALDANVKDMQRKVVTSKKLNRGELLRIVKFAPKLPVELPYGYAFESAYLETKNNKQRLHLIYTDGIETVSLFEIPKRSSKRQTVDNTRDRDNQLKISVKEPPWKLVSWSDEKTNYVLIGTINIELIKKMAESVSGKQYETASQHGREKNIFNYFKRGLRHLFGCVDCKPETTNRESVNLLTFCS